MANGRGMQCQWSEETYTPADFANKFGLPWVARLVSMDDVSIPPVGCLGHVADVNNPFIVYSKRLRTKGLANHVVWDKASQRYMSDGHYMEIPKDYPGFFEVLPIESLQTPGHHNNIRAVVKARCKRFLLKTVVGGFHIAQTNISDGTDLTILEEHLIYPGEVLTRVKIVTKQWRLKETNTRAETEYLVCSDSSDQELAVPLAHPGIFCALYDPGSISPHHVWRAEELLANFELPLTVRLVFGWVPHLPHGQRFSGVIRMFSKCRTGTLVVYNLQDQATVVGEIPMNMSILLQPASNQQEIASTTQYNAATLRCDRAAFCYTISMKLLDLTYSKLVMTSEETTTSKHARGMMSSARDMSALGGQDIFPPLNEDINSWPITFRDPITDNGRVGGLELVNGDADSDAGTIGFGTLHRHSIAKGKHEKDLSISELDQLMRYTDARRSRIQEMDNRETPC